MTLPKQTDSSYRSIKLYGCFMMVDIVIVAMIYGIEITIKDVENIWMKAREANIVWENTLPERPQFKWYRCWVVDHAGLMELTAQYFNKKIIAYRLYIESKKLEAPPADAFVYENKTRTGVHATGEVNGIYYNPDPKIVVMGVNTVRGWRIKQNA